ncbi:dipeptide/oligopeptide/nickel ABC transporter permease/ATP-binding protein [Nakamurella endophytica]|uniref:Peptide ABC transporter ATP-binding protein n=1 Tax=Nakamurella endophytica TaxID=1748367 RepID=A0A917STY0_9ACTN|nr:dipeptide/oligopeptide/nickel ABC transporter permease/ATP-binding protein [Nakamurella endophytica]GGL97584.1 peptide ABC transporter ATP-binding protein [Nakamurella endophytica]
MTTNLLADVESGTTGQEDRPASRFGWLRGFRSARTLTGVVLMVLFVLMALLGPVFVRTDPSAVSDDVLSPPSGAHLLGTTHTGQDVLAQLIDGSRISLLTGFVAAALATVLSLLIGLAAGYLGGLSDELLSLLSNIFLVIPSLPLVVILTGALPEAGSLAIIIVISLTSWAWGARVLRAQTLSLRKRDFVEAARASGESTWRIIFREILPNQTAIVAATFLSTVIGAILTQASLAFLGLTDVTQWSWGGMLYWAQNSAALNYGAWWWFVPPGLCIALVGTALSLINFGIDEFINPRLRSAHIATKNARNKPMARRLPSDEAESDDTGASSPTHGDVVLEIRNLTVEYQTGGDPIRAVDDVSLQLRRGEVLGIAGESGSGKSTLAYAITRLHQPPARITGGQLLYTHPDGSRTDLLTLSGKALTAFRWEEMSIVLQSAMNALNPLLRIGVQIDDALQAHRPAMGAGARSARVRELLELVGIDPQRSAAYPHELSGGMRQRVMIAIALTLDPDVIVMDEPTTALDVVTQRQILQRIVSLKDRLHFAVIFITHDLSMLIELSDRIAVMYAGRVVEEAPAKHFYARPLHPYSQGLLASFPTLSGAKRVLTGIAGAPPDLGALPSGCSFRPRCPRAFDRCPVVEPPLLLLAPTGGSEDVAGRRQVACLLYDGADAGRSGTGSTGIPEKVQV